MRERIRLVAIELVEFFDWRFWFCFAVSALAVLLIVSMLSADASRRRASQRITGLSEELKDAQAENADLRERVGANTEAIQALGEQVHQLGGRPVVTNTTISARKRPTESPVRPANTSPGTTTATTRPHSTTTTRPRPTTTTTTRRTTTTRPRTCVAGICL